ncbi:hypothetical protein [Alphaproteobacteria bacterium endosymbiont of Tiliacea citrago]|uniref:hypothetical protein n=1 Tax=Alphaproteobacteria bacterium endosymbiont of Tiliacea citrago TaxID=3077944 RepID=UPI00313BD87C
MKYYFLFFIFCFLFGIKKTALNSAAKNLSTKKSEQNSSTQNFSHKEFQILIKSWRSCSKGRKKFTMTNHKKEKISEGYLEWDLNKNEWIFCYKDETFIVRNNEVIVRKKNYKTEKKYKCSGFLKVLALPIERWDEAMPLDNEIQIDNIAYTEFKTNKSFFIICYQINPFRLINIIFGENRENYVLNFD